MQPQTALPESGSIITKTPVVSQSISGWQTIVSVRLSILRQLFSICREQGLSVWATILTIKALRKKAQVVHGDGMASKVAKVGGRYFTRFAMPGFPSPANLRILKDEVNRIRDMTAPTQLRLVFLAITNKCPLSCEHCFEWPLLNQALDLDRDELIEAIRKYQQHGVGQVFLSGGEPLANFSRLRYLLEQADTDAADFWVVTSGYRLDLSRALELKESGLTGLMISLDNHQSESHDRFRGHKGAFAYARNAVQHAKAAGLVVCLSLCVTRNYANEFNLKAYMELARTWGVAYVKWLDPRAAGRYAEKDVALSPPQEAVLDKLLIRYNTHSEFRDYPQVHYDGYYQRRVGCFGAGDRFLYLNSAGKAQACPFCSEAIDGSDSMSIAELREAMCTAGCSQDRHLDSRMHSQSR